MDVGYSTTSLPALMPEALRPQHLLRTFYFNPKPPKKLFDKGGKLLFILSKLRQTDGKHLYVNKL